jgi:2-desacetyl-2-hydroxyethyl bacteriochlorophyllide A dehydrogenase
MEKGKMKALVYEGPKILNLRHVEIPEPGEDEVLIRVERVGICGSELSGYLGQNSLRTPPLVMGHEFSGYVEQVGPNVQSIKVNTLVTSNPLISCMKCKYCMNGKTQLCSSRKLLGAHLPGAFAEYVTVPERNVYEIPSHLSPDVAALTEPLACAVHTCRMIDVTSLDTILIVGAGPIGLFVLQSAKLLGVESIVIMDIDRNRLKIAEEMGAKIASNQVELSKVAPAEGFDIAVDAVGLDQTRNVCLEIVKPSGRVVFTGLHHSNSNLPINDCIRKELKMYGAFAYSKEDFEIALKWIIEEKVNVLPSTKCLSLEEGRNAFETLLNNSDNVTKILLTP